MLNKRSRRDENEGPIVAALRDYGATVTPISEAGVPDLLVGYRGRTFLLEVKSPSGRITKAQREWYRAWKGGPVHIVITPFQAVRVLEDA